ncbi:hypothetical protein GCM10027277_05000 [Pseudoduganella ginsengisoli]|uniref:DUF2946 domain-containing protein n=1 Tax=Pseudoduganella ginsengisoli TaxID=1462440 RepID=A0A6L6Q3F4_9BURK|nr:hypothetical protein [Pseudoduganella ginsengisoli]MTW04200.1 hypothetical protein [Pseudoduganella ginsengisoli]
MLYSAAMTRKFLFFMLTIVALQFSWMAVSVYCGHESGRAAQHFGHHQHSGHAGDVQSSKSATLAKKLTPHTDCSSCSPAPLAPATTDNALVHGALMLPLQAMALSAPSSAYTPPPERPQWHNAA